MEVYLGLRAKLELLCRSIFRLYPLKILNYSCFQFYKQKFLMPINFTVDQANLHGLGFTFTHNICSSLPCTPGLRFFFFFFLPLFRPNESIRLFPFFHYICSPLLCNLKFRRYFFAFLGLKNIVNYCFNN